LEVVKSGDILYIYIVTGKHANINNEHKEATLGRYRKDSESIFSHTG